MRALIVLVMFFVPGISSAASIYIDPNTGTFGPGDTFIANVRLDTDECLNAVHVALDYPRETLRAVDFSRGGSILTLWAEEPKLEDGRVSFSGGIPGGYCGRIPGDPVISNILGKVVFTVISSTVPSADIEIAPSSHAYRHDGAGTKAEISLYNASFTIVSEPTLVDNPWLRTVHDDSIAPDEFDIIVESTRNVLGGKYYVVFSTVDKQSGLDHYEIFERGVWKTVTSPYALRDQSLRSPVQVRAIDKAGNIREGTFDPSTVPERQGSPYEMALVFVILALVLFAAIKYRMDRMPPPPDVPIS